MKPLTWLTLLGGLTLTGSAWADGADYRVRDTEGARDITFNDDPLAAGGWDPTSALIRVRGPSLRAILIRPRTEFVAALVKTVENL